MRVGDGVIRVEWDGKTNPRLFGIILDVYPDPNKLSSPFGAPWIYRVLWNDGVIKEHESGTVRRIIVNEAR